MFQFPIKTWAYITWFQSWFHPSKFKLVRISFNGKDIKMTKNSGESSTKMTLSHQTATYRENHCGLGAVERLIYQ
ncbi:hypothetical protein D3C87_362930 [compost metagenome]